MAFDPLLSRRYLYWNCFPFCNELSLPWCSSGLYASRHTDCAWMSWKDSIPCRKLRRIHSSRTGNVSPTIWVFLFLLLNDLLMINILLLVQSSRWIPRTCRSTPLPFFPLHPPSLNVLFDHRNPRSLRCSTFLAGPCTAFRPHKRTRFHPLPSHLFAPFAWIALQEGRSWQWRCRLAGRGCRPGGSSEH